MAVRSGFIHARAVEWDLCPAKEEETEKKEGGMTNEEIDALQPGPELDTLVAEKVMGTAPIAVRGTDGRIVKGHHNYSTSDAAALEVTKEIWRQTRDTTKDGMGLRFITTLCNQIGHAIDYDSDWETMLACMVARPDAICRAALKAVEK